MTAWRALAFALLVVAATALGMPEARAQDRAAIEAHVSELFGRPAAGVIRKWMGAGRYRAFGDVAAVDLVALRRIMNAARGASGHDIDEDLSLDNQSTNAPFVCARDIEPFLGDPGIVAVFRLGGESEAEFGQRMRDSFRASAVKGTGFSPTETVASIQIVNLDAYGPRLTSRQLLRLFLQRKCLK